MKIVYCATRWPIPLSGGRQTMILQSLEFCRQLGEVHVAYFGSSQAHLVSPLPFQPSSLCWLSGSSAKSSLMSLMRSPLAPLQTHLLNSAYARKAFRDYIDQVDPDVVIFDMLRTVHLAKLLGKDRGRRTLILDMDDLLSHRYKRMLENKNFNITGTFSDRIPDLLKSIVNRGPSLILGIEAKLIGRLENSIPRYFDAAFAVSSREVNLLKYNLETDFPLKAIPPAAQDTVVTYNPIGPLRFVFLGDAMQFGNSEALRELDLIARAVKARLTMQPARFEAAGRVNPALRFEALEFLGFVDDLDTFLGAGAVLVAPMRTGSGIKIKVLEAMSRGIPVITTALGVEGIEVEPGRDFICCTDQQDFVDTLLNILCDANASSRLAGIGANGAKAIRENHSHERLFREFRQLVQTARKARLS